MLRSSAVAAGLFVAGLAVVGYGVSTESDRSAAAEPAVASGPAPAAPATPVLSARRVPDLLVRPQAARRLTAELAPLVASAPAQTCLVVADGPTTLYAAQPDTPMPAASNQKLVTALTALDVLGPDATFTTRLAATSAPAGGVIEGDLWMIGGGDPVIDSDTYQSTLKYGKTPHTRIEDIADKIVAAFEERQFEAAVGNQHNDLRLALNAERELAALANRGLAPDTAWLTVIGSPPLRSVLQTAFSLPPSFAAINLDQQVESLRTKAAAALGDSEIAQFREPAAIEKLLKRFLLRNESASFGGTGTPGGIALQLLQSRTAMR